MKRDIHIGDLIKNMVKEKNLSINDFAESIHKTRSTVYDIFKRKSIDVDLLIKISEVLNYDFLANEYTDKESTNDSNVYIVIEIVKEHELSHLNGNIIFKHKL